MPGRIGRALERTAAERRLAFVPFLTSGFPDLPESDRLLAALCEEGADLLELGVPFSDPLADGPVIQESTRVALTKGVRLADTLEQARRLRARFETPLVVMTYLNPVLAYGAERFAEDAVAAGVDGLILVDLPPEEDPDLWSSFQSAGLDTIALVAPTTDPARLPSITAASRGYLYVVARLGVTGGGAGDARLDDLLRACREHSPLPRCVGFGWTPTSDVTPLRGHAEGVIVGSALIRELSEETDGARREERLRRFVRAMRERLS
ncbi:MAG TPA: tryptophan synthase subunit alpha [Candidatus Eisenbacteria bacterium]|nr:tryptophan synthase subunit alpha [Candidatus Eisenbacteria bacterium]